MLDNIVLKNFKKQPAVYYFESEGQVIYIGSSNNLYKRMLNHRSCINKGINAERNAALYDFLQSNQFTVYFVYHNDYKQLEQELIEKYNPKYNNYRANAGCGAVRGREAEWQKEYNQKFKEERKQHQKQYRHQLCLYNGETLTLDALRCRFRAKGVEHPNIEAKKYLIGEING